MLYVMFYFLTMGDRLLQKILFFLPLDDLNEQRLLNRFTSVTRATVKGTLIIGIMQGSICGVAFAIAGIDGPVFWGSLMAVTMIIPAFRHGDHLVSRPDHPCPGRQFYRGDRSWRFFVVRWQETWTTSSAHGSLAKILKCMTFLSFLAPSADLPCSDCSASLSDP